jgi:hypothetical protein
MSRYVLGLIGALLAVHSAHALIARDRLAHGRAEHVAASALETSRARFACETVERFDEVFAILGRDYDLPLVLRLQNRQVWAVRCLPVLKSAPGYGQRYRPRLVLIDAANHSIINTWTY